MQILIKEVICLKCGAQECHPADEGKPVLERRILIRGFKVEINGKWWSQCLVCSRYYTKRLEETPALHNPKGGWFTLD